MEDEVKVEHANLSIGTNAVITRVIGLFVQLPEWTDRRSWMRGYIDGIESTARTSGVKNYAPLLIACSNCKSKFEPKESDIEDVECKCGKYTFLQWGKF